MKPQNIKDKQNILKLAIKKQQIAYKGINLDCGIFKSNKSQKSMELRYIMRKEKKTANLEYTFRKTIFRIDMKIKDISNNFFRKTLTIENSKISVTENDPKSQAGCLRCRREGKKGRHS